MSYSESFPTQRPIFILDAANAGRLDSRISYTRSTTGSFYGKDKHISSENLLPYSNNVSAAEWTKGRVTVASVNNSSPDGGSDASLILETTDNNTHTYYDGFSSVSGQNYSFTFWVKPNGRTKISVLPQATGIIATLVFDLVGAGTVTLSSGSTVSHSITQVGDWYKCQATVTATGSGTGFLQVFLDNGSGTSYAGDVTKGIYVWGHQVSSTSETVLNATSGQIHRAYAPTLQTAAINAPRFEHSASDSASMGLLVEGSSTNLVSYSESLSNQTINNSTLTEGAAVGPDGTLNANLLVPTSTGATGRSVNLDDGDDISHTSGNNYAFSIYAKSAGYNYLQWVGLAYFGSTYCNFDLSNGTVGNKSGSVTGSVESVGNGWYRLTVIAPATTTNNTASKGQWQIVESSTSGRATGFTGNDYSGVLLTMAQCELGSFASSYIKSDSGSVSGTTRAADSASMPIASTGYSGNNGTMLVEVDGGYGSYPSAVSLHDGAGYERVLVSRDSLTADDSTDFYAFVGDKSGTSSTLNLSGSGSASKVAVSFATNDFAATAGGGTVVTSTSGVSPAAYLTTLQIGNQIASNPWNGHIKRIAIYSEALSDTNLQALTS